MASINEVMSHKNRDPKWMTDSHQQQQPGDQVLKQKHTGSNEKEASQPKAPKAPEIPQTHFRVRMCCNKCEEKAKEEAGEVAGVVSVMTDPSQSRVTVLGRAVDSAAVLKKLKRHVDKKATHWPADAEQPVPAAKLAVLPAQNIIGSEAGPGGEKPEIKLVEKQAGSGEKKMEITASKAGDMKGNTGYNHNVDDKVELAAGAAGGRHANVDNIGPAGMNNQPAKLPMVETMRGVAADPRFTVDPRMQVDPRMLEAMRTDPRMLEAMRTDPRMLDPRMLDPRMLDPRMLDPRMVDPRQVMRGGLHVDPRDQIMSRGMMQLQPVEYPTSEKLIRTSNAEMKDAGAGAAGRYVADHHGHVQEPMREARGSSSSSSSADHHMTSRENMRPLGAREMQAYEYAVSAGAAADQRREKMQQQQHPGAMGPPVQYDSYNRYGPRFDPREMRAQLPQESYYNMSSNKYSGRESADSQYQPKASYFSDYRPSQSYPANYSSGSDSYYEEFSVTNPNYMKQIMY